MYKKVLSILLSVLLLFSILPMSSAYDVGKTASLTIETVEVPEGHKDQIDVKFTLENAQKLKSFSLTNLTFDSSKLEFVSGRCENKSATMSQVLSNGNAVVAFTDNTDINGVILVYTFALAEGVIADEIEISATFSAKTKPAGGVETNVEGIELIPGKIIVKSEAPNAPDSIDNFEYELTNEGIVITGYTGTKANVIIAESYEIDGTSYDVVEIAMEAFIGQETIISVTIPETVKKIGEAAFYDCTSLTEVTILNKDVVIDVVALGYYYASRKEHIVEGFTIYGYEGSTAEEYANTDDEITFVALTEEDEDCPHNGGIANCQEQAVCDLCGEYYGDVDSNNHKTVVIDEAIVPDCESTGLTEGSHCSACNTVIVAQETVDRLGHNFTVFVETVDYTCDEDGYDVYKCSRCDATENKNFTDAACRPEADYTVIEKASCDKAGYKAILCSECKEEIETETIAKREHSIVDTTVATKATCLTEGVMNQKCDCAASDEYEGCTYTTTRAIPVDANNHEGTANVVKNAKDATCYAEGYTGDTYWSCCDALYSKGKATDKIAHTPAEAVRENEVASTCYKVGSYDEVVYCSVEGCKYEISRTEKTIEKTAHTSADAVRENEVAATCYKAGSYDEVIYCSVEGCKYEISRTEKIIEKIAHTPAEAVEENRIEATCAVDGSYDEVVYCSVKECKLEISREAKTIFATGEHNYATEVENSRVPSTCKTAGKVTMKCGCGATKEVALEIDATNHEKVVTDAAVAPDCENTGLTEGSHCSACDTVIVEQETVDKLGHDYTVFVETVDYTCDKDGYDVYKCSRCDATENKNFTDAACRPEADYTVIEKASCDKTGYKAILCSICKEELETETIAKREHNIVDTTVATKATCITEGVMNQKCDCIENEEYEACAYTTTRAIPVDAENHEGEANVIKNAKDATCYAEGYTGDTYWSCCDVLYSKGKATDKIAHTPADAVEESRTESTCKVAGNYDSVVYCSVCDEELSREKIDLPLADHSEAAAVEENRTDSTCKVAGSYDSVVYCSVCDEELSRDTIDLPIDPTNHSGKTEIRNAVTGNCGEVGYTGDVYCLDCNTKIADGKEIPANENHNYVGEETEAATCKATGVMTYTCSVCGDSYTEVIPVNIDNHTSSKTVIRNSVEATCVTEGYSGDECYECCGAAKAAGSVIPINADNHKNIVIDKAVSATCKESGLTEGSHCESCGTVIIEQIVIEKAGHIESTIPEVAPDCINDGLTEGIECLICGEILVPQESVAALGHIFTVVSAVYDENNVGTVVYECIDCGYEKTEEVAFDLADAFELIDEAEKKLSSDELTQDEREKIEASLAEFEAFIETYVVFDEEGNIIENNLPLNDSDVMTQYNKLLVNLDNAINGREASEDSASWGDIISRLIDLIIMLLDLVYKLVVYLKAN